MQLMALLDVMSLEGIAMGGGDRLGIASDTALDKGSAMVMCVVDERFVEARLDVPLNESEGMDVYGFCAAAPNVASGWGAVYVAVCFRALTAAATTKETAARAWKDINPCW